MDSANTLIVGYDIGNEFTQISCIVKKLSEPESVSPASDSKGYMIPTVLSVRENTKEWLFGEDAIRIKNHKAGYYIDNILKRLDNGEDFIIDGMHMSPEFLLEKFFTRTLAMLRQKYFNNGIAYMVITNKNLNNSLREKLYHVLDKLGLKEDRLKIINYTECFIYYILNQKPDIWSNDVGLFDYGEEGLKFYQLTIGRRKNPAPVIVNYYDLSTDFPYSLIQKEDMERMKYHFEDITSKLLHKRLISALYFTGSGFDGDWSDDVIKRLCIGRRVFKGHNLYTKGACYAAKSIKEDNMKEFFFLSEERITSTISLKIYKDAKEASVIFAKAGDYYYEVNNSIEVILDNENSLDFTISNLIRKDDLHAFLTLTGLPERENKTTCLSVAVSFADRNMAVIKVKDLGFGDICRTTYRIWEFRLEL